MGFKRGRLNKIPYCSHILCQECSHLFHTHHTPYVKCAYFMSPCLHLLCQTPNVPHSWVQVSSDIRYLVFEAIYWLGTEVLTSTFIDKLYAYIFTLYAPLYFKTQN